MIFVSLFLLSVAQPSILVGYFNLRFQEMLQTVQEGGRTHFSNTTPRTSSTSPATPRPVIWARQVAAALRCSAATTISDDSPCSASDLKSSRCDVHEERS